MTTIRPAEPHELDRLAAIWHDSWRESHEHLMPAGLIRLRTFASFRDRLADALPSVRVAGLPGDPVGFCMIKDGELYQLFVAPGVRGTGVAAALINHAETSEGPFALETWRYEKYLGS